MGRDSLANAEFKGLSEEQVQEMWNSLPVDNFNNFFDLLANYGVLIHKSNIPYLFTCVECGGINVEERRWVDLNTGEVGDDTGDDEVYCRDCEEITGIIYKDNNENKRMDS